MQDLAHIQGYINRKLTKLSVVVVGVLMQDGKVLMVKNSKSNFWSFPGGHQHEDESLIAGLKRELSEEIGNEIKIVKGPVFYTYQLKEGLNLMLFFYQVHIQGKILKFKSSNDEVTEARWFDIERLPENIYENTRTIIEHFSKAETV